MSNKPFKVKHGLSSEDGTITHKNIEIVDSSSKIDYAILKNVPTSIVLDTEKYALDGTDALSISGHTITLKKGDGSTETVTVPDNDTVYSHPTGAGNEHLPSSVSQTEAGYLDGVTSSIQSQLNAKVDDGQVLTDVPSGAVFTDTNTQRTDEEIRDVIGTAISGSGATTVTVNDAANTIVVSSTDTNTDTTYTAGTGITLSGTVFSASPLALTSVQTAATQTLHLALTAQEGDIVVRTDENKTYCHNGGTAGTMADYTLLATPTDVVLSVNGATGAVTLTHDGFSDFVANEHIDWTADQGAVNLHSGNYTDTTYTVGDGGLTQKDFTTTLKAKLDNITDNANNYVHPASHTISEITDLQTELDAKTAEAVAMAIALG